jgi:hypothetical protein
MAEGGGLNRGLDWEGKLGSVILEVAFLDRFCLDKVSPAQKYFIIFSERILNIYRKPSLHPWSKIHMLK